MSEFAYIELQGLARLEFSPEVWFYMNHMMDQEVHHAHSHNFLEWAFILGGEASHVTVKGTDPCKPARLIVIPKGAWHAYTNCHHLEVLNCLFSPQMLGRELAWVEDDPDFRQLFGMGEWRLHPEVFKIDILKEDLKELRGLLDDLEAQYLQRAPKTLILASLLRVLECLRPSIRSNDHGQQWSDELHPSVLRAVAMFRERMDEEWTLRHLATELRLNPSYLVRLFRRDLGLPPMKYLAKLRAESAANLLLSTRWRVGDIGLRVGWSDPKVFARNFRQHFGKRASQYREDILGVL